MAGIFLRVPTLVGSEFDLDMTQLWGTDAIFVVFCKFCTGQCPKYIVPQPEVCTTQSHILPTGPSCVFCCVSQGVYRYLHVTVPPTWSLNYSRPQFIQSYLIFCCMSMTGCVQIPSPYWPPTWSLYYLNPCTPHHISPSHIYIFLCIYHRVCTDALAILSPYLKFALLEPIHSPQFTQCRMSLVPACLKAAATDHMTYAQTLIFFLDILPCFQVSRHI